MQMNENIERVIAVLTKNIKENWRLLIVGIIILAIALNSSWNDNNKPSSENNENKATEQSIQEKQNNQEGKTQPAENSAVNATQAKEPKTTKPSGTIIKIAEKSEGITHLARKAVKEYLENNQESLSAEQKIYVEDYLKRKIGSRLLKVGEKIEFGEDTIKQGIEKTKRLNQKQIQNLSKYVPLARNLN